MQVLRHSQPYASRLRMQGTGAEVAAHEGVLEPQLHSGPSVRLVPGQAEGGGRHGAAQTQQRRGVTCRQRGSWTDIVFAQQHAAAGGCTAAVSCDCRSRRFLFTRSVRSDWAAPINPARCAIPQSHFRCRGTPRREPSINAQSGCGAGDAAGALGGRLAGAGLPGG